VQHSVNPFFNAPVHAETNASAVTIQLPRTLALTLTLSPRRGNRIGRAEKNH